MVCVRIIGMILIVSLVAADIAIGQMLPPQENLVNDTRRKISGEEGNARLVEALRALESGDLRSASAKVSGADFLVEPIGGDMLFRLLAGALVPYADEAAGNRASLASAMVDIDALLVYLFPEVYLPQAKSDKDVAVVEKARRDMELLAAVIYWQQRIVPMAWDRARKASEGQDAPVAASRLLDGIRTLCGEVVISRKLLDGYGIEVWNCKGNNIPQPLVLTWMQSGDVFPRLKAAPRWLAFSEDADAALVATQGWPIAMLATPEREFTGALTVERNTSSTDAERRYQVMFRDLDGPPLLLSESGPDLPSEDALLDFADQFPSLDQGGNIRTSDGWTHLRCQMEAVYAIEAELTPLAAAWCQQVKDSYPLLTEQVEKPLRDRKALDWELRCRHGAGDLNGLRVLAELPSDDEAGQSTQFVFEYGPAGPPTWEVLGYVNRDAERLHSATDAPDDLEHFHFAVGTGDDRLHVASFRLVSDRVGSLDRVYSLQYLTRKELVTLDVMSEPPSFAEFRNRVLDWVNAWPRQLQLSSTIVNSIGMELALIPAGEFLMGSPDTESLRSDLEGPQHPVKISRPFYMGIYEVTQAEYQSIMGTNPSWYSTLEGDESGGKLRSFAAKASGTDTSRFPVEQVSWEDAAGFCRKLSQRERKTYRLPTEVEWEYACRAGTKTAFHFGNVLNGDHANVMGTFPYGTTAKGPNLGRPTTVGSYGANAFGLFDMHGNVREWCHDVYDAEAYSKRSGLMLDLQLISGSEDRVLRGGSWVDRAKTARAANRYWDRPDDYSLSDGFRVVCELPP